jgi:hypothetical protein
MNKKATNVPMQYQRVGLKIIISEKNKSMVKRKVGAITLILNNVPNRNVMLFPPYLKILNPFFFRLAFIFAMSFLMQAGQNRTNLFCFLPQVIQDI